MPTMTSIAVAVLALAVSRAQENTAQVDANVPFRANLVSHFDAAAIPVQADNTALVNWTDSETGAVLTQATGVAQPKYRTNVFNGLPGIQFSGAQWLAGANPILKTVIDSKTYTTYCVVSHIGVKVTGTVFGNGAGGNSYAYMATGALLGRYLASTQMQLPYAGTTPLICFGSASSATNLYAVQSGVGVERAYVNGMAVCSNSSFAPATSSADGQFAVGATNSLGQLPGTFYVHDIFNYNRVLTQNEMLQLEIYIKTTKYAQALAWTAAPYIFAADGDSLTVGVGSANLADSYPYLTATSIGLTPGQWCMQAVGGIRLIDMFGKFGEWNQLGALTGKTVKTSAFEWYNERTSGAAAVYADMQTYCSTYRTNFPPPHRLGIASTTSYSGDPDPTNRDIYNSSLDSNNSFADGYVPQHLNANIGVTTAFATFPANWSDVVHLSAAGRAILAPLMTTMVNAL